MCCHVPRRLDCLRCLQKDRLLPSRSGYVTTKGHMRHVLWRICSRPRPPLQPTFFRALKCLRPAGKRVLKPFGRLQITPFTEGEDSLAVRQQRHFAAIEAGDVIEVVTPLFFLRLSSWRISLEVPNKGKLPAPTASRSGYGPWIVERLRAPSCLSFLRHTSA